MVLGRLVSRITRASRPQQLLLLYAILECVAFLRWLRERARIEASPRSSMSPKFDRERWGRFFAREMSAQRRPREILQRVFQAPIRNISRERAVHFLCFYLTCGELEDQEPGLGGLHRALAAVRRD